MDADLMREVRERYSAGVEADRDNRDRDYEDRQFYTGGDEQWPDGVPEARREEGRPCESYNRLPQFVKQVTGELRQNKPAIKVLPVDDQADPEIANIYSNIIRHIESNSEGHRVYSKATEQAVVGGVGWWRVKADYLDENSFDQDLLLEGIPNPLAVVCDPDAKAVTRSDMKWCIVSELVHRKAYEATYPDKKVDDFPKDSLEEWVQGDFVRIAEYWRKTETGTKTIYAIENAAGSTEILDEDTIRELTGIEGDIESELVGVPFNVKSSREVKTHKIESILVSGAEELTEWQEWKGRYIPIVRVTGEEVEAGDKVFRHGLIHHAKPAQRSYNFARNAMMERHATSPKSPYMATAKQIGPYKAQWETLNKKNPPVLLYEPDPNAPGPPQRVAPPQIDGAAYQESMIASEDMKATTGIYDSALGAQSNETAGVAIRARDSQGDTATYVYIDNMEAAIAQTGRILIDLIPHYYSDERVVRMIGEDGEIEKFEAINKMMPDGGKWNDITRGTYDVVVTTGPAYSTKRQEAADNLLKLSQIPQVQAVGTDIVVRALDLPMGDKLADRIKNTLPPGIDDELDKERAEKGSGQEQQPSPEQQAAMAEQQSKQADMEMRGQEMQLKMQMQQADQQGKLALAREKAEADIELELKRIDAQERAEAQKAEREERIAIDKMNREFALAERKMQMEAELKGRQVAVNASLGEAKLSANRTGGDLSK